MGAPESASSRGGAWADDQAGVRSDRDCSTDRDVKEGEVKRADDRASPSSSHSNSAALETASDSGGPGAGALRALSNHQPMISQPSFPARWRCR